MKPTIVIDSGPLIAVLFAKDRYHPQAVAGFKQLQAQGDRMVLPLPIVFEVYRWLLQQGGAKLAQAVFVALEQSFEVYAIAEPELAAIKEIVLRFPNWSGTLADASVVYVAMRLKAEVWTLDYRDLGVFPGLMFWQA